MIKIIDPLTRILASSCPLQMLPSNNDVESVSFDGHYIISTDCIVSALFIGLYNDHSIAVALLRFNPLIAIYNILGLTVATAKHYGRDDPNVTL